MMCCHFIYCIIFKLKFKMNKNSIYREQLSYYLDRDEDYNAMLVWIEEQHDLDQPDILRELAALLRERFDKTGQEGWLKKAETIEKGVDQFEEDILDKKLHKALLMMQFEKVESDAEQADLFLRTARETIIKNILSNPENNNKLWEVAHKIIKVEIQLGAYDPATWSAIFPLKSNQ
jgi:hypothetical protein